jgi:AraC-like DNA-binding protein/ligand-binding sensor protein
MNDHNRDLLETLAGSKIYQDYEQAFSEATGLPVSLRAVDSWQLPLHGQKNESKICSIVAQKSRACAACLQVQQKLSESARREPQTLVCPLGMCDTAVPVRLGEELIGFLQTGQVFRKKPTAVQYERAARQLREWGFKVENGEFKDAYFATRVMPPKQYEAMVRLLTIFAHHLSMASNQIVVQRQNAEPPMIAKAKAFIHARQAEDISLGDVARSVNTSTFYFCKMFKKITGLNFTHYLSRVRIEKAKNLLMNPNLRISEIAFEVGFQSLTHFNRVFKKIIGQSPTQYRGKLASA